jgi:hypothetical protein
MSQNKKDDRKPWPREQRYVLICQNANCGLRLQIGIARNCQDPCPRCGSPMSCRGER